MLLDYDVVDKRENIRRRIRRERVELRLMLCLNSSRRSIVCKKRSVLKL